MISKDEILILAFALEYEYSDEIQQKLAGILEKIESDISTDGHVGSRLLEYGKLMGWSKES